MKESRWRSVAERLPLPELLPPQSPTLCPLVMVVVHSVPFGLVEGGEEEGDVVVEPPQPLLELIESTEREPLRLLAQLLLLLLLLLMTSPLSEDEEEEEADDEPQSEPEDLAVEEEEEEEDRK